MTPEQKARAYDKLLIKAKQIYNKENDVLIIHTLEDLLPELKESEDEKTRKRVIALVNAHGQGMYKDDMLTWLENIPYTIDHEKREGFHLGYKAGLEKQGESSDKIHYWTEEEIEPIISDYLRGAEHYGGMIGRLRCLKPKSLEKQGDSPIKWNKNTEGNKPQVNHSVLMKTTHSIAEGEWKGEYWEQYRLAGIVRDSDVLSWMELSDLDKQGDANKEYWRGYREGKQEILDKYAELEKQGEEEQLYIRFGEIPTDEKSKIYRGEIEVGTENGVSVYPAFKTNEGDIVLGLNLPITKTTLYTQQHLIEYDDRPCYLVKGDYVGKDTDGQTLINNVSIIEKIDTYRLKEKKQGEQKPTLRERYKNIAESEWFKKTHEGMSVSDDEKVDNVNKIEQKPAWSEEDEEHYQACLQYFDAVNPDMVYYKDYQWLKSLKERIGE